MLQPVISPHVTVANGDHIRARGDRDHMTESPKIKVGIIGCGIATFHTSAYATDPRVQMVAIAGLDTDRCRALATKHDIPEVYTNYEDLLANADVDLVSVAVPNFLHAPVALAAIAAGKHVLMEKPLARNSAEGEQIVCAARDAGVIVAMAFNRRARPDMQVLKKHIDEGGLGDIYYAKAFWMRRAGIPGLGSWFTSKELAGGGPLIDLGVHVLDMALWLMDNPKVVAVSAATYAELGPQGKGQWGGSRFTVTDNQPYEVEDLATALLRMENGATLQLETSWAGYTGHTDEFGVSLMGNNGGAELHVRDYASTGTLRLFHDVGGAPTDATPRLQTKEVWEGHAQIVHSLVDGILHGTPVSPSVEEGLDRARLIDAIYQSAALGRELRLDELIVESAAD
jgi:predicted dehydrogenase